jgi:hypothetical protein
MIFGMAIGLLIVGVMTLATGKFTLTKTRAVTGPFARTLAFMMLAPFPLMYTAEGFIHMHFVQNNKKVGNDPTFVWTVIAVKGAIVLLCFIVPYVLGWLQVLELERTGNPVDGKPINPPLDVAGELSQGNANASPEPLATPPGAWSQPGPAPPPPLGSAYPPPGNALGTCPHCGHEISAKHYDRMPPWCPRCGKDMKR